IFLAWPADTKVLTPDIEDKRTSRSTFNRSKLTHSRPRHGNLPPQQAPHQIVPDSGMLSLIYLGCRMQFDRLSKRREFVMLLGGAAATWPLAARSQSADRIRRIGMLITYAEDDREGQARAAAFIETLGKLGWSEGRNVQIEYHRTAGAPNRAKSQAAEIVQ